MFYIVSYNGQLGWVWGEYVSNLPTGKYVTVKSVYQLNIRTSPVATAQILGVIKQNQYAEVLGVSADGNWYKISINGIQGYSSKTYLSYIY